MKHVKNSVTRLSGQRLFWYDHCEWSGNTPCSRQDCMA